MSGGAFDYAQYSIADIYNRILDEIYGHELDDDAVRRILEDRWLEEDEAKYIKEHHHTIPNCKGYSEETIGKLKHGVVLLMKAEVYAQRIDWLLSDDDGEESFHQRLKEDLQELRKRIKLCLKKTEN